MIYSLNQQGTVEESVGYVAEQVDKKAQKIVVITVTDGGHIEGFGFGEVSIQDLAFLGLYLQKRAIDTIDDDPEPPR